MGGGCGTYYCCECVVLRKAILTGYGAEAMVWSGMAQSADGAAGDAEFQQRGGCTGTEVGWLNRATAWIVRSRLGGGRSWAKVSFRKIQQAREPVLTIQFLAEVDMPVNYIKHLKIAVRVKAIKKASEEQGQYQPFFCDYHQVVRYPICVMMAHECTTLAEMIGMLIPTDLGLDPMTKKAIKASYDNYASWLKTRIEPGARTMPIPDYGLSDSEDERAGKGKGVKVERKMSDDGACPILVINVLSDRRFLIKRNEPGLSNVYGMME